MSTTTPSTSRRGAERGGRRATATRPRSASPLDRVDPSLRTRGTAALAPRHATQPTRRPSLRSVPRTRATGRHRRDSRLLITVATAFVFAGLFGLAVLQTLLAQNQARIDQLGRDIRAEQTKLEDDHLRVARLSSPGRIVDVAQDDLGMIAAPTITYLQPSHSDAEAARDPAGDVGEADETGDDADTEQSDGA